MGRLRRLLILAHRYLGIALSLLFLMWFLSGIAMIYAGGMPGLTPELRWANMAPLDFSRVRISAAEAFDAALIGDTPASALLVNVMGRPAYRFSPDGSYIATVFADTGELLEEIDVSEASSIAAEFANVPFDRITHADVLTDLDQWTIAQRASLPLHKILIDDDARTQLYISGTTADVVVHTTRGSRALAWVAAIPHWLYFAPLRLQPALWSNIVIGTSLLGSIAVLLGLALAVIQLRKTRPRIPYTGWLRWHYITGVIFGLFTLTWVFSGLLSMQPWDWTNSGAGLGAGMREELSGGRLELSRFPALDAAALDSLLPGQPVKEVEYFRIQGDPYFALRTGLRERLLVSVEPFEVRRQLFAEDSLLERLKAPNPGTPVTESKLLEAYDSYYYSREGAAPLPVLRVKFADPDSTWFYVDPKMGRIVARYHRLGRVERWIYHGFHSLDFSFWYYNRPLWDAGVIGLSLGGAALSAIGVVIAFKRLRRVVR